MRGACVARAGANSRSVSVARKWASLMFGVSAKAVSFRVDQQPAVFFLHRTGWQAVEKIQNHLARAAEPHALGRVNNRSVDQNRVLEHCREQRLVVHGGIEQPWFLCWEFCRPQGSAFHLGFGA